MSKQTADYTIKMQDGAGRVCNLFINGASIDELMRAGCPAYQAVEEVESNAFANAIDRGEIGDDAWVA